MASPLPPASAQEPPPGRRRPRGAPATRPAPGPRSPPLSTMDAHSSPALRLQLDRHHDTLLRPAPVRLLDLAGRRQSPVIAGVVHIVRGESLQVHFEGLTKLARVVDLPRDAAVASAADLHLHPRLPAHVAQPV